MGKSIYIEHDGALFRGFAVSFPSEVWSAKERRWKPYSFSSTYKPIEWGSVITESEAERMMGNGSTSNDAHDYPDVPGPSGLSEEYADSLRTPAIREAIGTRKQEIATRQAAEDAADVVPEPSQGDHGSA